MKKDMRIGPQEYSYLYGEVTGGLFVHSRLKTILGSLHGFQHTAEITGLQLSQVCVPFFVDLPVHYPFRRLTIRKGDDFSLHLVDQLSFFCGVIQYTHPLCVAYFC